MTDPPHAVAPSELWAGAGVAELLGRCHFPTADTAVTCAVSGGADSSALAVLAVAAGLAATLVHVDHGLRPGSHQEADVVAALAGRLGARFRAVSARVAPGPNLEARARAARYLALGPDALTGHTADDQAETVLLNLLRGASTDGLAGFAPDRRPLRELRRHETRALCTAVGVEVVADPSNEDPAFARNRVRHELVPLASAVARRDVVPVIARQAALLRDDAALLDELASRLDPTDVAALADAPAPLARRALRGWLRSGPEAHPPSSAELERVLEVVRGGVRACELAGGRRVHRHGGRLRLD